MLVLAAALTASVCASGDETLLVSDAWARATPPGAVTAAAYLTLQNSGATDRLVNARSDAAREVQIHTIVHEGGMMQMVPLDALPVTGGRRTTLEPGGNHLMLIDIEQPLLPGATVTMTLTFENAGERVVAFPVRDGRTVRP